MQTLHSPHQALLPRILERDVELVEITQAVPADVVLFAEQLIASRALAAAFQLPWLSACRDSARQELNSGCEAFHGLAGYNAFAAWAVDWAGAFAALHDAAGVSLRMTHARRPTCPRLHADGVTARLIATLAGPGTEWLPAAAVTLDEDGRVGQSPPAGAVKQMQPASVGIFKGQALAPAGALGVVHRSPDSNKDRVVFTLDIAH